MNGQDNLLGLPTETQTHRVISISASQSLHASPASTAGAIPTGLPRLDEAIGPTLEGPSDSGGLPRGHVAEVFGPPGVGKTSLALSAASNALRDGEKVVWIDTCSPLPRPRLKTMLSTANTPTNLSQNLIYFRAQSLPHLLALLMHPPKTFPPPETTLLIIDSISGPFPSYFPNPTELKSRLAQAKITEKSQVQWLMNRKWNVTSDLATQLMKLAAKQHMAVLVVNQTHTRIKGQPHATLSPVLSGVAWENSIYSRIALYRDFPEDTDPSIKARFAEVMKRSGRALPIRLDENIIPFTIESDGLREITNQPCTETVTKTSPKPESNHDRKRKVDEIADSQDEDSDEEFGWVDGDDADLLKEKADKE